MQLQFQAFARGGKSLRKAITDDLARRPYPPLMVERKRSRNRRPGWSKLTAKLLPGAINFDWDAAGRMLMVRAVTRRQNRPHALLGVFLQYLFERHGRRIASINIQLTSASAKRRRGTSK